MSEATNFKLRKTQEERAKATRDKLCRATLETISKVGYHNSTTPMIAERAGVSRGAQTHHFPTKYELVTAAFEYLMGEWEEKRRKFATENNEEPDAAAYVEFLWAEVFNDPNYVATLEMLLAARGDPKLKAKLTELLQELSEFRLKIWRTVFHGMLTEQESNTLMRMTICLFRGMSMQSSLDPEALKYHRAMLQNWTEFLTSKLEKHAKQDVAAQ